MARYRIFEARGFLQDLSHCPQRDRGRIERKLEETIYPILREEPHAGAQIRKLRDWQPETWRYRGGDWRCFYEIDEKDHVVMMIALKRRTERTYK